jgi:lipopolysaccharide export system protein LptA
MRSFVQCLLALMLLAVSAAAQEAQIAFKGLRAAADAPVEITADTLELSDQDQTAVFKGNVVMIQGDVRLSAKEVLVDYAKGDKAKIDRLTATGGVLLASPSEAAEAEQAVYSLTSREIEMTGNVLLTQGQSVMSGQTLVVNLDAGTGRMEGRVKAVLSPGSASP